MAKYYDVMVDIETTGVHPDENGIIQIAAAKFDLATQEIDTTSFFDMCLHLPQKRFWDEDTRGWWLGKNRDVYETLKPRFQTPRPVLEAFSAWVVKDSDSEQPRRFWSKPTTFDFPFLQSYFDQFELPFPFHYRFAVDVNSFIRGQANDMNPELNYRTFEGPAHNAIVDVLNQIGNVFEAVKFHQERQYQENVAKYLASQQPQIEDAEVIEG